MLLANGIIDTMLHYQNDNLQIYEFSFYISAGATGFIIINFMITTLSAKPSLHDEVQQLQGQCNIIIYC